MPRRILTLAALIGAHVLGCGTRAAGDNAQPGEPIEECDSFVEAYGRCLTANGPETVANARAEQTRAGLAAQIQAAHGAAARGAIRTRCTANLSQLKATCR